MLLYLAGLRLLGLNQLSDAHENFSNAHQVFIKISQFKWAMRAQMYLNKSKQIE